MMTFLGMGRSLPVFTLVLLFRPDATEAQKVTIKGDDLSIPVVLRQIGDQSGYSILYSAANFTDAPKISLDLENVPVRKALQACFAGLRYRFDTAGVRSYIISRRSGPSLFTDVTGIVENTVKEPLAGATLTILDTKTTITADTDGLFHIPVTHFETLVSISYAGYSTQTVLLSNRNFQDIRLETASVGLDAAVSVAYGKTTQRLTTASVTKVKGAELDEEPNANLMAALEGRATRLSIRQYNGVPGSAYEILLGGRHSVQQGNEPLFVLDGVPLAGGSFLSPIGSGSAQGPNGASSLNGIPKGDIASVEVLKDASATAIYGSRAANGVILITTKEGEAGRPHWTAEVDQGGSRVVRTSPLLTTPQFLALREEAVRNDGFKVDANTVPEAFVWDSSRNGNFRRLTSGGTGNYRDIRIAYNGGDKLTHVLLSGTAHNESGVFPGINTDQRMSLYGSARYQSTNHRLRLNFSGLYNREDTHLPREDYSLYQYLAPNAPAFTNAAGQPQWGTLSMPYENIPALGNNTYSASVDDLFAHLQMNYTLNRVFSVEASIGGNSIISHEQSYRTIAGQNPGQLPAATGNSTAARDNYKSGIVELWGRFVDKAGLGRLEALAGVTYQGEGTDNSSVQLSGVSSDLLLAAGSGATSIVSNANRVFYRYEALFGRVNYNIDNKYLLTLSGRRDGSSRFGPGDQFGNFWGLGAGWVFSEESFAKKWKGLSFGKLRGSYGTTGNDQIGDDQYAAVYTSTTSARGYQGQQGVVPASLANNQLHWELNHLEELALDLGFFRNKVLFSAGGYQSHSNSQLVYTGLPPQAGFPGVLSNQPVKVVNRGLEFRLETNNLAIGNVQWSSALNFTLPQNYLASWPGLANSVYAATLTQGRSLSVIHGLHFTGVDPATGLYTFLDVNHNGRIDLGDLVPTASLDPKWYAGWSHTLQYKGWGLDIFLDYRRQNGINPLVVLDQRYTPGMQGPYQLSNGPREWLNHWRQPGDHSNRQRLTSMPGTPAWTALQEYLESDAAIIDASFLRVKTVALHYQFPRQWLQARHLRDLRLYIRGQNLWTVTHFPVTDPETQDPTVLPPMRTLVAGIQLSF